MKSTNTKHLLRKEDLLNKMADYVLLVGSTTAMFFIVVGIILFISQSNDYFPQLKGLSFHETLTLTGKLKGIGLTNLGIFMLMVTPFLRVVTCVIGFFLLRWWRFTFISLFVLAVLTISMYFRASL